MRILHVANTLSNRGNGIVNVAVDLAIEQRRAGHTVGLLAGPGGYEQMLKAEGVDVLPLDQSSRRPLDLLKATLRARTLLRQFRPDIVHAHMQTGLLLCLPWIKLYRIPSIGHLHNVHDKSAKRMALADRLITVSAAVAEDMQRQGVPPARIRVVLNRNLQSPRQPSIATLEPAALAHPAVLTIAGMNHRKGIAELLQAFDAIAPQFPGANLYLAGEGSERKLFEEQASRSPVRDRIHFLGFHASPHSLMLASDVFVLASRRDSCPLVLGEARLAGCAIVASDVDGIPEALDGGAAGILVPPQSPAQLAEAVRSLLADDALRTLWKQRAASGLEKFSVGHMVGEVMELYLELLDRRPRGSSRAAGIASLSPE
jgi:glycosyltransferase involved in cell wall biosynthesis